MDLLGDNCPFLLPCPADKSLIHAGDLSCSPALLLPSWYGVFVISYLEFFVCLFIGCAESLLLLGLFSHGEQALLFIAQASLVGSRAQVQ